MVATKTAVSVMTIKEMNTAIRVRLLRVDMKFVSPSPSSGKFA